MDAMSFVSLWQKDLSNEITAGLKTNEQTRFSVNKIDLGCIKSVSFVKVLQCFLKNSKSQPTKVISL